MKRTTSLILLLTGLWSLRSAVASEAASWKEISAEHFQEHMRGGIKRQDQPPLATAQSASAALLRAGDPGWIARCQEALIELQLRHAIQAYWRNYSSLPASATGLLATGQLNWVPSLANGSAVPVLLDGASPTDAGGALRIEVQDTAVTVQYPSWEKPLLLDMELWRKVALRHFQRGTEHILAPAEHYLEFQAYSQGRDSHHLLVQDTATGILHHWEQHGVRKEVTWGHINTLCQLLHIYGFAYGELPAQMQDAVALVQMARLTGDMVHTAGGPSPTWESPLPVEIALWPAKGYAFIAIPVLPGPANPQEYEGLAEVWSLESVPIGNVEMRFIRRLMTAMGGFSACPLPARKSKAAAASDA